MIFYKNERERKKTILLYVQVRLLARMWIIRVQVRNLMQNDILSNFHNCQFIFSNFFFSNQTIGNRVQYTSIVNLHSYAFERKSIVKFCLCAWPMMTSTDTLNGHILLSYWNQISNQSVFIFRLNMEPMDEYGYWCY